MTIDTAHKDIPSCSICSAMIAAVSPPRAKLSYFFRYKFQTRTFRVQGLVVVVFLFFFLTSIAARFLVTFMLKIFFEPFLLFFHCFFTRAKCRNRSTGAALFLCCCLVVQFFIVQLFLVQLFIVQLFSCSVVQLFSCSVV